MSDTTTYRVLTVYEAVDKASRSIGEIEKSAKSAARTTDSLSTVLKTLGAGFVGGRVFSAAKSALIDYNSSLEQSKTVIAGMLTMYSKAPIEKSWDRAAMSVSRFQDMAKKSSLTTRDLVETMSGLTRPLMQAGVSVSEIEKMSFGVANAAKAFGMNGSVVAMDIEQAITTRVSQRDRFARNILAQREIGYTDIEKFNALSVTKRVEVLKKALQTKAITDLAKKQGEDTMAGVLSTLQDNFEILAGKVGLPLFKAITNEVKNWNAWIEKNQHKIDQFGKAVSSGLVKGFSFIKDVFTFLYRHADTLIAVAKAYAAIKLGSMIGGGLGGSGTGMAGQLASAIGFFRKSGPTDRFNPETGAYEFVPGVAGRGRQAVGGLKGAAANADLLGASLGGGYMIGSFLNDALGLKGNELRRAIFGYDSGEKQGEEQRKAIAEIDKWFEAAKAANEGKGGLAGSNTFAQLQGKIMQMQDDLNKQSDKLRTRIKVRKELGFEGGLLDDLRLDKLQKTEGKKVADLMNRQAGDMALAAGIFAQVTSKMKKAELTAMDMDQAQEEVMRLMRQRTAIMNDMVNGFKFDPMKKDAIAQFQDKMMLILNPEWAAEQALKKLKDPDDDFKGAKAPNTQVNITIQRVMAKDPNKWLAEMDDMVQRRTRAKTRAKGAWKNTPK